MIHLYYWDASQTASNLVLDQLPATRHDVDPERFLWIDLDSPTPEEEQRILEVFLQLHLLTIEDITRSRRLPEQGSHLPKVEEFPQYLFVIVNPLPKEICEPVERIRDTRERRRLRPQLSAVLMPNLLITHHYDDLPCVRVVRTYLNRRKEIGERGPDYLFHLILDEMVDEYAPVVERIATRLDRLETQLFTKPSPQVLPVLLRMKRRVSLLRKTLVLEREVLARLVRGEFALVTRDEIVYYRNVYDHLVRYHELVENGREMVSDLMQTHLSAISNRMNEVMKVLTMISTIGMICTLIAGIYGMNFENMPEIKWQYGYPMALGMMASTAVAALILFHWKKWF